MNLRFSKKIILSLIAIVICAVGLAYYVLVPREAILDYNIQRDKKFILSLFDKDWYWLSGYSREDVDTDVFLERQLPPPAQESVSKLVIKVMYVDKQPVGFVAHYMKSPQEGIILFLDVAPTFRRRHYGHALVEAALEDLRKKGAHVVRIITRPQNIPAQNLYRREGFKEYKRNIEYVFFEKKL